MKLKIIYICSLFILISNQSISQNKFSLFVDDEEDDSITKRYYELHDGHWAGIDFGVNLMLDKSFNRNFDGNTQFKNNALTSYNFRLNFIDHKFVIKEDKFGITIGAGYHHSSFDFIKNYTLKESFDKITDDKKVIQSFDSLNFTYNKIRASYLQIPLLFEYTPNKFTWVSLGVIAGYRFGSSTKNLFEYQKVQYISKTKGNFNLNTFQCDATARFGYKSFGGYVSYALISLFNSNDVFDSKDIKSKIPTINPLSFGLTFNY
jgi:hypothetical protein